MESAMLNQSIAVTYSIKNDQGDTIVVEQKIENTFEAEGLSNDVIPAMKDALDRLIQPALIDALESVRQTF